MILRKIRKSQENKEGVNPISAKALGSNCFLHYAIGTMQNESIAIAIVEPWMIPE